MEVDDHLLVRLSSTMFRQSLAFSLMCIAAGAASEAAAQWVRIGPLGGVSIRVPFVSVDVDPWGGTRVRAPFTAVDAPGHRYHHDHFYHDHYHHSHRVPLDGLPAYGYSLPHEAYSDPYRVYSDPYRAYSDPYRPYSDPYHAYSAPRDRDAPLPGLAYPLPRRPYRSNDEVADGSEELELPYSPYDADWLRSIQEDASNNGQASASAIRRSLTDAALRLHEALDRRSDGQVWQDYLQPARVAQLAADGTSATASGAEDAQLRELLVNFDGVTANESLRWVTQLEGFAQTRQLLQQLVSEGSEAVESSPATQPQSAPAPEEAEELPPPMPEPEPEVSERPEPSRSKERFEA